MKRIAIYARVSTSDKGQDTQNQISDLRDYCKVRGWTDITEYADKGISGTRTKRPALDRLMEDVRTGKINVLVVWKLDRLFRSLKHLMITLDELATLKVGFISIKESLDLTTPAGRFMMQVLGAVAEFERGLIQERIKASYGGNGRSKRGNKWGRKTLNLDTDRILKLHKEGESARSIAKIMGCSHPKVLKVLKKEGLA